MDFVPDYEIALKQISAGETFFGTYSQAYTVTNEKLRKTMRFMPEKCQDALVVAGSGDHPLFCSLYGAKNVDTFDISYNAKCIMDIKVAALQCLNYKEYTHLLDDLYAKHKDLIPVTEIAKMGEILSKLPKTERDYIYALRNVPMFSRGDAPKITKNALTFCEYYKLRAKLIQPYNFMLTDIMNLSKSLTKSYDFIHLSNVFDYVRSGEYANLVLSLMEHINPGGRIVTQFLNYARDEVFGFYTAKIADNNKHWNFSKKTVIQNTLYNNGIYVLERTR